MVSGGSVFGYLSAFMLPVLVAPLIEGFGFNEYEIGIVFTLELSGIALAAIVSAMRAHSANLRLIGIAGVIIACLGHTISILTESVPVFGISRVLAGIGEGAVLATTFAAAARASVPERAFAVSQITIIIIAMALLVATPRLVGIWDYRAGIAGILAALIVFAPSVMMLPVDRGKSVLGIAGKEMSALPHLIVGSLVLAVYVLMNIADMGIWAFSERTGNSIGIAPNRIGEALATAQFLGIVGSMAAAIIATRFGRMIPMTLALFACIGVVVMIGVPPNAAVWTAGVFSLPFVTLFFWPYLLGALAALDELGVWTALGGAASAAGVAIGPILAGYLAERFSYREMTWILCLIVLIGVVLIHVANRRPSPWHSEDEVVT